MQADDIAIIGAGLAGLACGQLLQQAGHGVQIFDKGRGVGGRLSTRRGEGWQCDHGAQYFTARHPEFRAEVERWLALAAAARWEPRLRVIGDAAAHTARPELARYVGSPRMNAPARLLAEGLSLSLRSTVQELVPAGKGWQLRTAEQGTLPTRFAAVLLGVPAPQAVTLLPSAATELGALAAAAPMRGSWAVMARYQAPLTLPFDAAFVNAGPLRWVARDSGKPGRSGLETWLLHANGSWSDAHMEASTESVGAALLRAFAALGAPAPQAWTAHRWRYAAPEPPLQTGCAWDGGRRLGLCGDWLEGGRVEGAWLSGRRLARQVLASLGGP